MISTTHIRSRYLNRRNGRLSAYTISDANPANTFTVQDTLDQEYDRLYRFKSMICPFRPRGFYQSFMKKIVKSFRRR